MALTPEQQVAFDKVKAAVENIEQTVAQSLNLQANGGYHIRNLAIELKPLLKAVEDAVTVVAP
jgi:hypothetical protein